MSADRTGDPILAAVDLLTPAFEASGLDELEVEAGELVVRLARPSAVTTATLPAGQASAQGAPAVAPGSPWGEPAAGMRFVTAPLTGVWYSAPSPGARPYLHEGDEIGVGSVVGLIEAMKLFNEIKSDVSGRVTRTLVETGTLVKRQQPLLEVDPRSRAAARGGRHDVERGHHRVGDVRAIARHDQRRAGDHGGYLGRVDRRPDRHSRATDRRR
jgi:acetyl-CoA carboxylase biotin carboxyl carrier protein